MLVESALQQSFPYNPTFEDFFNMDLYSGPPAPGAASNGSSQSPSSSPSGSFTGLPPTPPNPFLINDIAMSPSPFFNPAEELDQSKLALFTPPQSTIGYNFLQSLTASGGISSPESSGSGSGDSPVGIDPQLVGTPAPSKEMSEFDEDEERDGDDDDLDAIPEDFVPAPVKVGGKGKSNRKGTVQGGGIAKRAGSVEKKENAQPNAANMLSTTSADPDDWRPTPEEYKKMSSKEKRQLRNKISARNFRVRRKEYISTLEGDIAERDRLIDAIRTELGSTKNENVALRQEISALKKALLEGRGRPDTPVLPPPAPLPAVSAAVRAAAASPSPLRTPNTQKDLPTSPRAGTRGFWGGAQSFGGVTPVHTTLVPEWGSILSGKPVSGGRRSPMLQENINPSLNPTASSLAKLLGSNARQDEKPRENVNLTGFDAFADVNPFTMKSIDAYRMHLWGKMAQQQALNRQAQHGQTQQQPSLPQPTATGLAGNIRPHYFSKTPALSSVLSGKSAGNLPGSLPKAASSGAHLNPTPQQAVLATMASQTLLGKLGGAFWDAFARPTGTGVGGVAGRKEWDAEKVRKVMEGTAVLRVVDVEPTPTRGRSPTPSTIQAGPAKMATGGPPLACVIVQDLLAESMASLTISHK